MRLTTAWTLAMTESSGTVAPERLKRPRIGITIGDPAGIGPEVTLKAIVNDQVLAACVPVLIGDAQYLAHWSRTFCLAPDIAVINAGAPIPKDLSYPVVYNLNNIRGSIELGQEQPECGRAAAEFITAAVALCQTGDLEAMTTAPINKRALSLAGYLYPGHTEFLAHLTGCTDFAMAFISPALRVVLLTTHVPLAQVPSLVSKASLERLIRLVDRELRLYGLQSPRIAVAALNPHGGEGGLFGVEETAEMIPAIEACRDVDDINVSGPHPGDTVFLRASRGEFDVVISCYHDQALIPVKFLSFGEAVNVTLGLPFIRTSVDHGTAFDIAGQGRADDSSMIAAIILAADLYRRRHGAPRD